MKTTVLKKNATQSLDELCGKRGEARSNASSSEIEGEDREAPEALKRSTHSRFRGGSVPRVVTGTLRD
jgi:hypothetical protein